MSKHRHILREMAKFASGLVAADFMFGMLLMTSGLLPIDFWSITWVPSTVAMWMLFDTAMFLILVYYGWHAEIHAPSISQRNAFIVVGIITCIIALLHAARLVLGVAINVAGWNVPYWISWVAVAVAAYISYSSFVFATKTPSV